jgi:hypothetical protein
VQVVVGVRTMAICEHYSETVIGDILYNKMYIRIYKRLSSGTLREDDGVSATPMT